MKSRLLLGVVALVLPLAFYCTDLHAGGYPGLLKNGLIDEVDSGDIQVKDKQDNQINEKDKVINKTGKFSVGVEGGYSRLFCYRCYLRRDTAVFGVNGGYWINNRVLVGLDFLYHIPYKNTDQDGGPDVGLISIVPEVKVRILKGIIKPTLGFGFGAVISYYPENSYDYGNDVTYLLNFSGGVDLSIKEFFSAGTNLTYNIVDWSSEDGFLTLKLGINFLF
ncbi:MAG: hypothetical protein PHE84_10245 [bacterium]|nr:hypothetical protein [bacterium]